MNDGKPTKYLGPGTYYASNLKIVGNRFNLHGAGWDQTRIRGTPTVMLDTD